MFNTNTNVVEVNNVKYTSRFARGVRFEHMDRIHELTIKAVDKVRDSRFRFDVDAYNSKEGKDFITEHLRKGDERHGRRL